MFDLLKGLTISEVSGLEYDSDNVIFKTDCGKMLTLYHSQDCCEYVAVEDVSGDVADIIGTPVLLAEERESDDEPILKGRDDSNTWTFYTIRTVKGTVDIRWIGSSNGYYSESVYCRWDKA